MNVRIILGMCRVLNLDTRGMYKSQVRIYQRLIMKGFPTLSKSPWPIMDIWGNMSENTRHKKSDKSIDCLPMNPGKL